MKKAIFINNVHEHDYLKYGKVHILYYSEGEQWSSHVRGETVMSIKDTGNGLVITSQKKKNNLDYSEAIYLDILLRIIHKEDKIEMVENKIEL